MCMLGLYEWLINLVGLDMNLLLIFRGGLWSCGLSELGLENLFRVNKYIFFCLFMVDFVCL